MGADREKSDGLIGAVDELVGAILAGQEREDLALGDAFRDGRLDPTQTVMIQIVLGRPAGNNAASDAVARAVARVNGRFGKLRICEILKGSESAQLIALGLQRLPTYGLLHDWSIASIRELVDLLAEAGYLKITGLEYPVLALSPRGLQAMKGEIPIEPFPEGVNCDIESGRTNGDRRVRASDLLIGTAALLPAALKVGKEIKNQIADGRPPQDHEAA